VVFQAVGAIEIGGLRFVGHDGSSFE